MRLSKTVEIDQELYDSVISRVIAGIRSWGKERRLATQIINGSIPDPSGESRQYDLTKGLRCQTCHNLVWEVPCPLCTGRAEPRKYETRGDRANTIIDPHYEPPNPAEPTRTIPGTYDRIQEYARRVASGEAIFHPEDLRAFEGVEASETRRGVKIRRRQLERENNPSIRRIPAWVADDLSRANDLLDDEV